MKKNILKLSIISFLLFIVSVVVILVFGKTYTFELDKKNFENYELKVDNFSGKVKIIKQKQENDKIILKVKGEKEGRVNIYLEYSDFQLGKMLYIHKTLIITDNNFFGKCTGSEIIPISLSIILLYLLYILIKRYNYCKKENLYQYKNIAYLGIIIFILFFTIINIFSIFNYQGLFETVNNLLNSVTFISLFMFPIALITFILVTISNLILIKREGKSLKNLLGLFLGIIICISTLLPDKVYILLMKSQKINIYNLNSIGPYIYNFIETLVYLTISYLECIIIGTIIIAIKSIYKKVKYNKDYIIIFGCQIRKDGTLTPLLKGRVDRAIKFRNEQLTQTGKDLIFIPSGGKGEDEIISEAQAMKNYLIECGINEKNILIEDKSKKTYENIIFSCRKINQTGSNICFCTTNYHVLRAGLISTELGLKLDGIGSKTRTYFWINAFIREFIGTIYYERKKHIFVFIAIVIFIILMIAITYLANNI